MKNQFFQYQRTFQAINSLLKLVLTTSLVFISFQSFSISYTWNGTVSTNWRTSANWTPNGIPTNGDDITLNTGALSYPVLDTVFTVNSVTLNNGSTVNLNGFILNSQGIFTQNTGSTVNLNGGQLNLTGTVAINAGTISDASGTGRLNATGTSTIFGTNTSGPDITGIVSVTSNQVLVRNTVFHSAVTLIKQGPSNDYSWGNNTFNQDLTLTHSGSGNMIMSNNVRDIYNGDVYANNTGTNWLQFAYNDVSGTQFNGNLIVSCSTGSGIYFCQNTGRATLAAGKTITASGFDNGSLQLRGFTQAGATAQNIILGGNASLVLGPFSEFNGSVTASAWNIYLNGSTYNNDLNITKTGSSNNNNSGNNTFNGTATITNAGSGELLLGYNTADNFMNSVVFNNTGTNSISIAENTVAQFNGPVTLNNLGSGSGAHILIADGNAAGGAVFQSTVLINNNGTATSNLVRFGLRGPVVFHDDVTMNSTGGTQGGIAFGWSSGTGSCTLQPGKNIIIGSDGFSRGTLTLAQFTQLGTEPISYNLSGTAGITFGPSSALLGDVNISAAAVSLNGCSFGGTASFVKTGSTSETSTGGNTFSGLTNVTLTGSGSFILGGTNPDIFNGQVSFSNNANGNIYIAHTSAGNQFNAPVYITTNGTGTTSNIFITEGNAASSATFNSTVTAHNGGASTNSYIRFAYRGTCTFNEDITVSSTNGTSITSSGIWFSNSTGIGTVNIASGKSILIGPSGFTNGMLNISRHTQADNADYNITLTGSAGFSVGPLTTLNGNLTVVAPSVFLNGCTIAGNTVLTKNGNANDASSGGNTFQGTFEINNTGAGTLTLGNVSGDVFNDDAVFNNSGTRTIHVAYNSTGNIFNGTATFNNIGSGTAVYIYVGDNSLTGTVDFNGEVFANNTGTATNGTIRFAQRANINFNENITVNCTMGTGAYGIHFSSGATGGTSTLANGKSIVIGTTGFDRGTLSLTRFVQTGNTAQSLSLTGTGSMIFSTGTHFQGNLTANAWLVQLNGARFDGTTSLIRNGTSAENSSGGNIFNGAATLTHNGASNWVLAVTNPDTFNGTLNINNTGTGYFYLAHNAAGNLFNGNVVINNNGSGADARILFTEGNIASNATFNGTVNITNQGSSTTSMVRFAQRGHVNFNENVQLNSINGNASSGIYFSTSTGVGITTLAATKTMTIGPSGFSAGLLGLYNLVQTSAEAWNYNFTGTGGLIFGTNSVFNGTVDVTASDIYFHGSTFNAAVTAVKNSNTSNACNGNNTFNDVASFTNNGTGTWTFSNSTRDIYNNDVALHNVSTGIITMAYVDATGTQFNGDIELNNYSTGSIRFGQSSGIANLANGSRLTIGAGGFAAGQLYLRRFVQLGNTAQSLTGTGTALIYLQTGSIFNADVFFDFPQLYLNGATYNSSAEFIKSGASTNTSTGGNVFNGNTIIRNSSTGLMHLANTTADTYNGNVQFTQTGTGALYPAYNNVNIFSGDISTTGTLTAITFGYNNGSVILQGSETQTISSAASPAPVFRRLTINNSGDGIVLTSPVSATVSLTMTDGIIYSDDVNYLAIDNTITTVNGVSDNSHVEGPVRKTGNNAFTFPIGQNNVYRPLSISAPATTGHIFTASYFDADGTTAYAGTSLAPGLNHVSTQEYWILERNAGASGVTVTLSWSPLSGGITDINALRVGQWDSGLSRWNDNGNASTTGDVNSGTITASVASTVFGPFTLASASSSNPLPVNLISFNAERNGTTADITWSTASESNNDYFTIEKSTDNINYNFVVKAKGNGNSTSVSNYHVNDPDAGQNAVYYRLSQTDFDGTVKTYQPVRIEGIKSVSINIWPNPFAEFINLDAEATITGSIEIRIMNVEGKIVFSKTLDKSPDTKLTVALPSDLSPGIYFLSVYSNENLMASESIIRQGKH